MTTKRLLEAVALGCDRGGQPLLRNINFALGAGEIIQVSGRNGVGKTTLLRALVGLYPLALGEVRWHGETMAEDRLAYQRNLHYLGHRIAVKPDLTVLEQLRMAWRFADDSDIKMALARFDLLDYQQILCGSLSQGQKQRVSLAGLAASNASLWVVDEPFAALDDTATSQLEKLFTEQLAAGGGIVFTSHRPVNLEKISVCTITL